MVLIPGCHQGTGAKRRVTLTACPVCRPVRAFRHTLPANLSAAQNKDEKCLRREDAQGQDRILCLRSINAASRTKTGRGRLMPPPSGPAAPTFAAGAACVPVLFRAFLFYHGPAGFKYPRRYFSLAAGSKIRIHTPGFHQIRIILPESLIL